MLNKFSLKLNYKYDNRLTIKKYQVRGKEKIIKTLIYI